jgi:glycosyltransferase involved in cell wall biosynthesis
MEKNKNILVIAERFYPEEFGINDLVQAWQRKGYKVAVLTQVPSYPFGKIYEGYKNRLFQFEEWQNITIHRVFSLLGYKKNVFLKILNYLCFSFLASFVVLFIGRKYNKVFVYHIGPLTQAIPAVFIKKFFGKRVYIWTLDVWPESVYAYGFKKKVFTRKILDYFVGFIYRNCEKIFVSCKGFVQKIEKYTLNVKIIFSPQWAPQSLRYNQTISHTLLKEGFNFTFAGNIGKVQNLENIIRGFASIAGNNRQINLNIIGDGSNLENLKEIVEQENIENLFFWGRKPLNEMLNWFGDSDVLIISLIDKPVFSLTVPAKFQAYLVSGKPIYCVVKGETADLVVCNKIGFTAQPDDTNDIKLGFERFLNISEQELESFKANAKALLHREFDREQIIQKMTQEIFQ